MVATVKFQPFLRLEPQKTATSPVRPWNKDTNDIPPPQAFSAKYLNKNRPNTSTKKNKSYICKKLQKAWRIGNVHPFGICHSCQTRKNTSYGYRTYVLAKPEPYEPLGIRRFIWKETAGNVIFRAKWVVIANTLEIPYL